VISQFRLIILVSSSVSEIPVLQMVIAGYILSIYQFMLEERGQSVVGFTPVRRRGNSSQTQVSSIMLQIIQDIHCFLRELCMTCFSRSILLFVVCSVKYIMI